MAARDLDSALALLDVFDPRSPSGPVPLRESLLDGLTESLVTFALMTTDLAGVEGTAYLWIRPRIERVFEEIASIVEDLGE